MGVELSDEADYKLRYVGRMAALIGTFEGCQEAADIAWDHRFVNGADVPPEESAERLYKKWSCWTTVFYGPMDDRDSVWGDKPTHWMPLPPPPQ